MAEEILTFFRHVKNGLLGALTHRLTCKREPWCEYGAGRGRVVEEGEGSGGTTLREEQAKFKKEKKMLRIDRGRDRIDYFNTFL
jgi:hypothetical protein